MQKYIFGLILGMFSSIASAHPGHDLQSAYAGFMHPFTGWDHLLVMVAIGLWAAKIGGKTRWLLPLAFMMFMSFGALLGLAGVGFSGQETAIATSLVAIGFIVAFNLSIRQTSRFGLVALFALFHGLAHGIELNGNQATLTIVSMLLSTSMLHAVGLLLGSQRFQFAKWISACLAWFMVVFGGYLMLS